LPDRPPPAHPSFRAEHQGLRLPAPLLERVRQLSLRLQTTPYVVMLAAFKALLARYTGQDDITVGSPSACRLHARHEKTVGYFSNTLV
ncbi:condensation domain-containing protein, partial [Proteus faecis]|uniref:condensation domain-containing protein n=1 Tax=Proteus faecis TaxID=2050967 RepID=UPI003075C118